MRLIRYFFKLHIILFLLLLYFIELYIRAIYINIKLSWLFFAAVLAKKYNNIGIEKKTIRFVTTPKTWSPKQF